MQVIISDTGPLNYLVLIDQAELLPVLFSCVLIPDAVHAELTAESAPAKTRAFIKAGPRWLEVRSPQLAGHASSNALDAGERAAIDLAIELGADLLLIDDRAATKAARAIGFRTTGTLGLLVLAAQQGLVDLEAAFNRLKATSFRCRQDMFEALLERHRSSRN